jgi:predicted transcriptional regulator
MALPAKTPKTQAGVSLDIDVMNYLDEIADSEDRDRSYVINRIIREWAESKGTPIPLKRKDVRRVRLAQ